MLFAFDNDLKALAAISASQAVSHEHVLETCTRASESGRDSVKRERESQGERECGDAVVHAGFVL